MNLLIPYILWTATAAWAAIIFFFSSLPGTNIPSVGIPDYIPHFIEYFVFAAFLTTAIMATKKQMPASQVGLWAICITSIYAASDEFHQSFVPGRTPELKDWAVDVLAAITVAAILFLFTARPSHK